MAVPDVLTERADLDLTWTPPTSDEPSVDPARPTLLYHPFRLSAAWREDADANRRVLLEPSWFDRFPAWPMSPSTWGGAAHRRLLMATDGNVTSASNKGEGSMARDDSMDNGRQSQSRPAASHAGTDTRRGPDIHHAAELEATRHQRDRRRKYCLHLPLRRVSGAGRATRRPNQRYVRDPHACACRAKRFASSKRPIPPELKRNQKFLWSGMFGGGLQW